MMIENEREAVGTLSDLPMGKTLFISLSNFPCESFLCFAMIKGMISLAEGGKYR
jgi:hypothetical protein